MSASESTAPAKGKKINLRTPDVMANVQEQAESHYRSTIVERLRANGGVLLIREPTVLFCQQCCLCDRGEHPHDLPHPGHKPFEQKRIFLLNEAIRNSL